MTDSRSDPVLAFHSLCLQNTGVGVLSSDMQRKALFCESLVRADEAHFWTSQYEEVTESSRSLQID